MNDKIARRTDQLGGITILVCFMLLVLLTVAAIGMSRNSLREIIIVGVERQGVEVRNLADNGLDWSIGWIDQTNRPARNPDAGAQALIANLDALSAPELQGQVRSLSAVTDSAMVSTKDGVTRKYDLDLIQMGQLEMPMVSQTPGVAVQNPVMWSLRTRAVLDYGTLAFNHSRESWVLAPPPGSTGQ